MKITDVEAIVLDTRGSIGDPQREGETHGVRFVSLLKITTDSGIVGWSDIETQPHVARQIVHAPSSDMPGFMSVRDALLGEDPLERERLRQKMIRYMAYFGRQGAGMQVMSGVDIALWDIAGKAFGQPVYKLLGAGYRDRVKAYASTLFRPTPDAMKSAVAGYLALGFRAIKFGWGVFGLDAKLDEVLVRAARDEAGTDIDLMVDPGWYRTDLAAPYKPRSLKAWGETVRMLEQYGIFWMEDFLPPDHVEGYAEVGNYTTSLRLAAGEQYGGFHEFVRLVDEGRIDVVQPDLSRCGGLTVAKQVADLATQRQIDCVPHAWLTDLLKAASLHLNAYLLDSRFLEFNVSTADVLNNLCCERIEMHDGWIPVPQGPGLGVEPDPAVIEKYRVD